ncbi:hypothetical protein JMM81_00840 [Bacillus sp. V3B]|uniref:PilN domain-containing protein n=1 Tax=Bacillus sp. V3B TaxID=2804915 RepID=UPI00210CBF92|nr:PilN domain-containing protein [Bacillus sp. V3B]MCQ6273520.1 hypothetical protein [Bacillus sp. V3B]
MLVDINLLPEKDTKNKSLLLLAIISVAILLIDGFFVFWLNRTYENKIASIEQQIASTEALVELEQQKMTSYESSDSLTQLEQTVEWAKQYPIKTVPVLNKLTELLPERGFIQTFNYEETGRVNVRVQFESTREAAYYLNTLLKSDWIEDAKLKNIDAETGFYDKQLGDSEVDETLLKNEKYVPRYVANFDITLSKNAIKNELASQSSEQKGGEDS